MNDKMPKPMSQKKYLSYHGNMCPICESERIEGGNGIWSDDDGTAVQDVHCIDCNTRYIDHYKLSGYTIIEKGKL